MQHNQTLPQCIRANAEKIGAFLLAVGTIVAFLGLMFVTWTAGG